MSVMLGSLYDALIDAGSKPDKAKAAAEEVARYEQTIYDLNSDLRLVKWVTGSTFALVISLVVKAWL